MLTLLLVIAVLLGLLAIPVAIDFHVQGVPVKNEVRFVWAFGLVNVRLRDSPASDGAGEPVEALEPAPRKRSRTRSNPLAALRQREFRRRLLRFVRDLWHAVHKEELQLHVQLGLGDPADTGRLWAVLGPLSGVLRNADDLAIDIEPDFAEARLDFESSGRISLVPLEILGIALAFALSPPVWRGLRAMRT